ncbi:hypothetical protein GGQ68_001819 [Sagittula marina]|uniref:DUF3299 domain-containing protein n=1 Tax=Sagittula marina TaxID=943940 RepID=A0A7W6GRL3_9RHOB|nr:hypothetical protein [Sagittula marina]MBB3985486.1 hypothetical protein [Sagittula marina]
MRVPSLFAAFCLVAAPAFANPWELITGIEYAETETETEWKVEKTIPEALRAQAEAFEITGFYVPVEAQPYVSQFLIVPDPEDCPFCGSNGYGPTLEVHLSEPMEDIPEATEVKVRGTLNFDESTETYRAVFLTDAEVAQ